MPENKKTAGRKLITVRKSIPYASGQSPVILPSDLLQHNYVALKNHYFIHDIQEYAKEFSAEDNIYILAHEVTENFPLHTHDFFELTYVCSGTLINIIDGNELYMHQGDITIINDNAIQSLRCVNPDTLIINFCIKKILLEKILTDFPEDNNLIYGFFQNASPGGQNFMYFSESYNADLSLFISRSIQEYTNAGFHETSPLQAWLILLFHALSVSKHYSYYGIDEKALQILQYIRANCISHSLKEMAGALGYNANYLTGYLKKHTGKNYNEIKGETRLRKAAQLLAESDLTAYEVAEACGYSSPSHFFRLFREKYGITPQKYRRQF